MTIRRLLSGIVFATSIATLGRAQVISQLKDLPDEYLFHTAIDGTGKAVYALTTSNQLGANATYLAQILRFDPVTGGGTQITSFAAGVRTVSVTDDGQWLAFVSEGDLTGANNDRSAELFIMHPDGTGLSQITSDTSFAGDGVISAMISGSGDRILFSADTDPLGMNPQRIAKIFAVNRDGTGLVQLGGAVRNPGQVIPDPMMSISDDGENIAFIEPLGSSTAAITIAADGSNREQRSTAASRVFVSGDGTKLVVDGSVMNWDGTGIVTLPSSWVDGITDDGSTVFYQQGGSIRKIGSDGTGDAPVSTSTAPYSYYMSALAGDGSWIATTAYPSLGGGKDQLVTMDGSGGEQRELTSLALYGGGDQVTMLPNATRIFFGSAGNWTGANPQHARQVFTVQTNGTGLSQVTSLSTGFESYSASDGAALVFASSDDLLGTNPCHNFVLYGKNASGAPVQLTLACPGSAAYDPQFRFDGQWIVFQGDVEIFKIKPDATGLAQVTSEHSGVYARPRLSAGTTTTWIVYQSDSNDDGLNPSHLQQIVRIALDGTNRQRITNDQVYDSWRPDTNLDGSKIVWASLADVVGENPGHFFQVFLRDTNTATTRQMTHESCNASAPRITRNGAWVYTVTCSGLIRIAVSSGAVERVQGFGSVLAPTGDDLWFADPGPGVQSFSTDTTGTKTAIAGYDLLGLSPHSPSLYLVDQTAKPKFTVGKTSPTLLTWDPDPQSIRYDVVRGNVANLALSGTTVDLGAVVCLEDDSGDNTTAGHEDVIDPDPGEVFFYLYRGTVGDPPVTGSYGLGSGNRERVATSGGCNP